ncbi:hypothetical protein PF008_g24398 [Phytophthora fragariae]|uniref:Uncharacterized protein n=1 Tax=Phytophthora fragariae TaxID=53985 RepID=A0A6G0QNU3_9STRA|nr:hypothetical protein PF008_g24398 [Phytophthora fragariae]
MPLAAVAVALLPAYPPSLSLCYRHLIPGNVDLLPSIAATGGCGRVLKTSIRHTAGILPLPLISSLLLSCRRLLPGFAAVPVALLPSLHASAVSLLSSLAAAHGVGATAQNEHTPRRRHAVADTCCRRCRSPANASCRRWVCSATVTSCWCRCPAVT